MPISLSLQLRDDLDSSEVDVSGFNLKAFDDQSAGVFGIPRQIVGKGSDSALWNAIKNWWGRPPDEFVTSDPVKGSHAHNVPKSWTPYADSWGEENQVRVEQKAVGVHLIETTGSVDSIVTANIRNYNDKVMPGQEAELSYNEEVEDTRYNENTAGMSLTNGMEVTVGGEFAGFKGEAKRTVEFTVEASHTRGHSKAVTKGRAIRLKAEVDAEPNSIYPVSVLVGRGSLKVKVDYEYRLMGTWRALYIQKPFRGKLTCPASDINGLLEVLGKPQVIYGSEVIDVGFVTNGDISIGKRKPL